MDSGFLAAPRNNESEFYMPLHLSTYVYGEPRRRREGVRIGCARLPARGVRKEEYAARGIMDVWLPTVAPSRELLGWALKNDLADDKTWNTYVRRYRREMKDTDARQTIALLALIAENMPISLGCYCRTAHCHRFELERLIRAAAQ
jgi:uncharacterized protein YeaO (DUF488 family)